MIRKRKQKYISEFDCSYDEIIGGHFGLLKALFFYSVLKLRWDTKNVDLEICPDVYMYTWYVIHWDWKNKGDS